MNRVVPVFDATTVLLLGGTLLLLASGQVLFKLASGVVDFSRPVTLLSPLFIAALAVYAVATLAWMIVLSRLPLSVAFPFYGLIFLLVPVLARLFLGEPLRPQVLIGGAVILLGVAISSYRSGAP